MINCEVIEIKNLATAQAAILIQRAKSLPFFGGIRASIVGSFSPSTLDIRPITPSPFSGLNITAFSFFLFFSPAISTLASLTFFRMIVTIITGFFEFFLMFLVILAIGYSSFMDFGALIIFSAFYLSTRLTVRIPPIFSIFGSMKLISWLFNLTFETNFRTHVNPTKNQGPSGPVRRYCLGNEVGRRGHSYDSRYSVKNKNDVRPRYLSQSIIAQMVY